MEIDRNLFSKILFSSTYVAIVTQILGVLFAFDSDTLTYLNYLKILFFILTILSVWSHYKASYTDPGKLTHEINSVLLEFYINLHEIPIKRAEKFNQSYGKMLFKKIDEEDNKEEDS